MASTTARLLFVSFPISAAMAGKLSQLLHRLLTEDPLEDAARAVANEVGAEHLMMFVRDRSMNIALPAPGFPKTLPQAKKWRELVAGATEVPAECELTCPWRRTPTVCRAIASWDGSVAVLMGGEDRASELEELRLFLPLVGRGLQIKAEARIAFAEVEESRIAAERAGVLAQSLDAARRELQKALESAISERTRAEAAAAEVLRINEELKSARDLALDSSRAKSAFLANMSHELRTPLNAIIGYAEIIRDEAATGDYDALVEDAAKIRDSGRVLLGLISDILDLSKIEAGKVDLEQSSFRIEDVLTEVANLVEPLAHAQKDSIVVENRHLGATLYTDRGKVRQILVNLASNAVKFTSNGTITFSTAIEQKPGSGWIQISVTDTGVGIHPDQIPRLFDEFSQLDTMRREPGSGTGLGLAISRRLAEMLGGTILVESELGRGSTFVLTLPCARQAPGPD